MIKNGVKSLCLNIRGDFTPTLPTTSLSIFFVKQYDNDRIIAYNIYQIANIMPRKKICVTPDCGRNTPKEPLKSGKCCNGCPTHSKKCTPVDVSLKQPPKQQLMCKNKCGRPRNGTFATCCNACIEKLKTHTPECTKRCNGENIARPRAKSVLKPASNPNIAQTFTSNTHAFTGFTDGSLRILSLNLMLCSFTEKTIAQRFPSVGMNAETLTKRIYDVFLPAMFSRGAPYDVLFLQETTSEFIAAASKYIKDGTLPYQIAAVKSNTQPIGIMPFCIIFRNDRITLNETPKLTYKYVGMPYGVISAVANVQIRSESKSATNMRKIVLASMWLPTYSAIVRANVGSVNFDPVAHQNNIITDVAKEFTEKLSQFDPPDVILAGDTNNVTAGVQFNAHGLVASTRSDGTTTEYNLDRKSRLIDYICVSRRLYRAPIKVSAAPFVPAENLSSTLPPNRDYPSDHVAIEAVITM